MSGQLQRFDDDGTIRCFLCGADAAGPCIRCRRSVCGDCCVLVDGKAQKWAVCLRCEGQGATEVSGWGSLGLFFVKLIAVLAALVTFLAWLAGDLG